MFSLSITGFSDDFFLSLWLNLCHFLLIFVIINSKNLEIWVGFRKFGRDFLGGIFSDSSDLGGILGFLVNFWDFQVRIFFDLHVCIPL